MDVLWLQIQRTERWHENAKLPNGDAANSQPDRGCNANGAGVVEAKQDGPMVNSAKKLLIPVQAAHRNEMMSPAVTE
jgi:hypothetical protein